MEVTQDDATYNDAANKSDLDHCAPNFSKAERLRRLALKGTVRKTGYQTYSVGNYNIAFSAEDAIRCK